MNSGLYAAFAGLKARTMALDVAANNLANAETAGFRAHRPFYRSLVAQLGRRPLAPLNQAINNFGVLGGAAVDLQQGLLERTGGDLDLAIEGPGFFVLQTPAGERYTRNGNFHLSPSGQLLSASGYPVLGEAGPVQISGGPVSFAADGTVSIRDAVAGRLRLVEFAEGTPLRPEGNSHLDAPAGAATAAVESGMRQGFLEASNMNPVAGAVGMIALQRQAEALQRTLSVFHTEFNRTAVEDLPRV